MSGFDLVLGREAIADALKTSAIGQICDVHPYVDASVVFPALGIFPDADYVIYHQTYGSNSIIDANYLVRCAAAYSAIDSLRLMDQLLSSGAGQDFSIVDVLEADVTLGGQVENIFVQSGSLQSAGAENAPLYEAVVRVGVMFKRTT